MLWRYEWGKGLWLVDGPDAQVSSALGAIAGLEHAVPDYGSRTGGKVRHGLQNGFLTETVIFSLSAWCDSEGRYQSGVEPARTISRELFNGHILPRLQGARGIQIRTAEARDMLQRFLTGAGALAGGCDGGDASQAGDDKGAREDAAGAGFPIRGKGRHTIQTLEEWFRYAPPAGGASHWREGRSAMELARRWLPGRIPEEVQRLLDGTEAFAGFAPERGSAESKTPLDDCGGNTRNHDLIVTGRVPGARANLDIEGKADETFGETIARRLAAAKAYLRENPRSNALSRVRELCAAVFGQEPEAVGELRYQLLHAVAASLIRSREDGADRVAFIVHEFQSACVRPAQVAANAADLTAFVSALGGDPSGISASGQLLGPFFVPGNAGVPADVALYIGKAICVL
jgi:hypothetical protein